MRYAISNSFDDSPQAGSSDLNTLYQYPVLGFTSVNAPVITLTGHITKDADTSSSTSKTYEINEGSFTMTDSEGSSSTDEVKMLGLLAHASRTKGYKQLYFKDTTSKNIFYGIATETTDGYKCFNVRILSMDITETPDSKLITWNATLVITR